MVWFMHVVMVPSWLSGCPGRPGRSGDLGFACVAVAQSPNISVRVRYETLGSCVLQLPERPADLEEPFLDHQVERFPVWLRLLA